MEIMLFPFALTELLWVIEITCNQSMIPPSCHPSPTHAHNTTPHTHTHQTHSPGHSGYWKDVVVLLSSSLCLLGLLYALRQRRTAQTRIDTFLESIRIYERELNELKERWVSFGRERGIMYRVYVNFIPA